MIAKGGKSDFLKIPCIFKFFQIEDNTSFGSLVTDSLTVLSVE